MTATDHLRQLLDERGVEWEDMSSRPYVCTSWRDPDGEPCTALEGADDIPDGKLSVQALLTPEQVVEATLGRGTWVSPTWERWYKSLRHDEIKSIGDAVEQLMYEVIEFGGDMGPNGNTCEGIDEGDVLTSGFINEWIARFESTLGRVTCRNVSDFPKYEFVCSECGGRLDIVDEFDNQTVQHADGSFGPRYCPSCGRKVEQ